MLHIGSRFPSALGAAVGAATPPGSCMLPAPVGLGQVSEGDSRISHSVLLFFKLLRCW